MQGDNMKYFILMVLASLLSACSVYSPDAGHEVVLVEKPWLFGHGGVDPVPVKPGRTYAALSTDGVDVYMQPMKAETEMHDTMTSHGFRFAHQKLRPGLVQKQPGGAVQDDGPTGSEKARHERDGDQHDGARRDR
jgi:hypothetical protein